MPTSDQEVELVVEVTDAPAGQQQQQSDSAGDRQYWPPRQRRDGSVFRSLGARCESHGRVVCDDAWAMNSTTSVRPSVSGKPHSSATSFEATASTSSKPASRSAVTMS